MRTPFAVPPSEARESHLPLVVTAFGRRAEMRGWWNTVGNLNELFLFRKADHGPRFADICAKQRGVRFQ